MSKHGDRNRRRGSPFNRGDTDRGFTVLPMLAGTLVLIVLGTFVVTTLA